MWILLDIINLLYFIIDLIKVYWLYFGVFVLIIIALKAKKNYRDSENFLKEKTWFIVIDGKFETWKTRFMSQLAKDSQSIWRFVLSNFYNWYSFIKWNSLEDLKNLLYDVWLLWEYQNFTDEELKRIYQQDGKDNLKEKIKQRKEIKKKYKNIPCNWFYNSFLILWDEFQNYMFNRGAMSNFSWENKNLLKLFHQVRHFNSLCVLWTQESDELDVKFRRLSTFYINTLEKINWLIYWYNVYSFVTDKENNLNIEKANKYTKIPVIKLNLYFINKVFKKIQYKLNALNKYHDKLNYILHYDLFSERKIKFRFNQLDFHTKYNVNPDIDTYTPGDLFKKLDNFYKQKDNYYLTQLN